MADDNHVLRASERLPEFPLDDEGFPLPDPPWDWLSNIFEKE